MPVGLSSLDGADFKAIKAVPPVGVDVRLWCPPLLVVPPDTAPEAARAAMAQAVRADNVTQANQILIDTRSAQVPPE
ncbi:hypothetical protein [Streptomyces sp. NPDC001165]|uniref:hypothetical protein n=1 Tax=Streptomyces sp. NPDC001165 TaxID=3364546 RepID=UPI0036779282